MWSRWRSPEPRAILTAATLLARKDVAGAWVVFSGWTDATPGHSAAGAEPRCQAAVLALVPYRSGDNLRSVGKICISFPERHSVPYQSNEQEVADLLNCLIENGRCGGALTAQSASGGLKLKIELSGLQNPPRSVKRLAARRRLITVA